MKTRIVEYIIYSLSFFLLLLSAQSESPQLSWEIPEDVIYDAKDPQNAFDNFSWALFVAMNWPTKDDEAESSIQIGESPKAPRVWEKYVNPAMIFENEEKRVMDALKSARENKVLYRNVNGYSNQCHSWYTGSFLITPHRPDW